jgi:antirestriction protein
MNSQTVSREISNRDNVIDSRDVIARIAELEAELGERANSDPDGLWTEERAELAALRALQDEAEGSAPDWRYGCTLIRDSYFEDYARELAEEIGAIRDDARWPCTCIDWERAARELRMDYTAVDFDGVTYWVR